MPFRRLALRASKRTTRPPKQAAQELPLFVSAVFVVLLAPAAGRRRRNVGDRGACGSSLRPRRSLREIVHTSEACWSQVLANRCADSIGSVLGRRVRVADDVPAVLAVDPSVTSTSFGVVSSRPIPHVSCSSA